MMPIILIDENLYEKKFIKAVKARGYKWHFLGKGIDDMEIKRFMLANENYVLVTRDHELSYFFSHTRCFCFESDTRGSDVINLLVHFMSQFE